MVNPSQSYGSAVWDRTVLSATYTGKDVSPRGMKG